ncbi:MAG: enolase C-terminal domain-like protein [Nanoarchaeota archaeon]|nr:enolase C-terminal domain-like protein [Nanoarchaeota archaeon]
MKLKRVKAEKILNSRRQPTIQIIVNGKYSAAAPSGASTGEHEIRAYPKEGIDYVIKFINSYKGFEGMKIERFEDLETVEKFLPIIKGNPMIALEFAILKAASDNKIWKFLNPNADSIPMPLGNVIGGGAHVKSGVRPDIQEFLLLPRTRSFKEAKFVNEYIHRAVGQKLGIKKMTDEGAWSPKLDTISILELLQEVVEKTREELGIRVSLGLDVAASELFTNSQYKYSNYSKENAKRSLNRKEQISFMELLIKKYDLKYVEDPFQQNDFESFKELKNRTSALICGDDLTTTNIERLQKAKDCINSVIIKPNQIGSLLKTREAVMFAKKNDITPIISHRSGETMDATISHLAVAWNIPIIKCGIYGKERQAKLKEILKIEKEKL